VDAGLEQRTLDAEDDHWWYQGRLRVVTDAVARCLEGVAAPRILDIGCGGGATLSELAKRGAVTGVEPSAPSRTKAEGRGVATVMATGVEALPFEDGAFDLALLLDVIEHLDDDVGALTAARRVVARGGGLVVTVPAHPRLWSRHDERNHHRRRYTRQGLVAQATAAGWRTVRATHFMTGLLPVAALARRIGRGDGLDVPVAPLNALLCSTIRAEAALIRRGASLPFGLSLLAELRRD
jgi:SAM-dependent methyltransferase